METATEPDLVELDEATTAVIAGVVAAEDLPAFFDRAFPALGAAVATQGAAITGPAFARYDRPPSETVEVEVGFLVDRPIEPDGDVRPGSLPGGPVARLVHRGSYEVLGTSWERLRSWIEEQGHEAGPVFWEVYVTEPSPDMDPGELRTELNWPVA